MAVVLVEREDSLTSLQRLLGEALDGGGRLVFLGGEAGVGKTAVATALARAAGGPAVRRGHCDHITTAEVLGPILDALPELAAAAERAEQEPAAVPGGARGRAAPGPRASVPTVRRPISSG
jgi:MoxR-like ATPase